jgi:hypothetical protein
MPQAQPTCCEHWLCVNAAHGVGVPVHVELVELQLQL